MSDFYENLEREDVLTLDRLARLLNDLRDSRTDLLKRHGAEDEADLMARITRGELPEHPAYEDYLGVRAITRAREAIRADLRDYMLRMRPA